MDHLINVLKIITKLKWDLGKVMMITTGDQLPKYYEFKKEIENWEPELEAYTTQQIEYGKLRVKEAEFKILCGIHVEDEWYTERYEEIKAEADAAELLL